MAVCVIASVIVQTFTDDSSNYHVMNVSYCYLHEIQKKQKNLGKK